MHNNYEKPSIFQWFDGKEKFQMCKTFEQTYGWLSQNELLAYLKLTLHKTKCIETPFIFNWTKDLNNCKFCQLDVLWHLVHNNLKCNKLFP